jgi:hypothetical protein
MEEGSRYMETPWLRATHGSPRDADGLDWGFCMFGIRRVYNVGRGRFKVCLARDPWAGAEYHPSGLYIVSGPLLSHAASVGFRWRTPCCERAGCTSTSHRYPLWWWVEVRA